MLYSGATTEWSDRQSRRLSVSERLISFEALKTALACGLLLALVAFFLFDYLPKTYTARASLLVRGPSAQVGVLAARGNVATSETQINQLRAQLARLSAENDGQRTIAFPPDLTTSAEPAIVSRLQGERALLTARWRALDEAVASFRQERDLAVRRAASLNEQVRLANFQRESIDREVAELQKLVDRGLAPAPRLSDLQRTAATIASRKVELESELLRTQQSSTQSDQKVSEAQNKRLTEVLAEQQKTRETLAVLLSQQKASITIGQISGLDQRFEAGALANHIDALLADDHLIAVAKKLAVNDNTFLSSLGLTPVKDGEEKWLSAAREIQRNASAVRIGAGSKIEVRYKSGDAKQSITIADELATSYVEKLGSAAADLPSASPSLVQQDTNGVILRLAPPFKRADPPSRLLLTMSGLFVGLMIGVALTLLRSLAFSSPSRSD